MKDKNYIELILRMHKNGEHSFEDSVNDILWKYSDSKRFNIANFMIGVYVGVSIAFIILYLTL
jgi:hypothetical protein